MGHGKSRLRLEWKQWRDKPVRVCEPKSSMLKDPFGLQPNFPSPNPPLPKPPGAGRKDGGPTGGRGPRAGGGGGNPFDRAKDALRCAASLSQAGSVNNITGKNIPIVGGNFFGDLTGAALGPEPGTDPTIGLNDRIDQGVNAVSEGVLHETVQHAVPQIAVGVFNGIGQPVSYAPGVAARFATQERIRRALHKRWMRQG